MKISSITKSLHFAAAFLLAFSAAPAFADVTGTWSCNFVFSGSNYPQDLSLSESGGTITGHEFTAGTTNPFATVTGTASGNSFHLELDYIGSSYAATADGTVSGNTMSGTWQSNASQSGTFSCTKISDTPGGGGGTPTPTPGDKRPTKTNLFCNRTGVLLETAKCTASVADAGPQPVSLPTGTIDFTSTGGFFPASSSCFPTQTPYSPGIGACEATFAVPNGFPLGAKFPIDATYSGDATFASSSTSHKLIVASCVGTTENPCKNSIGLDFPDTPRIIQDTIDALLLCGQNSTSTVLAAENKKDPICIINADGIFEMAQVLDGITPDQFRAAAAKITSQQANGLTALANMRKAATTLSDAQLTQILRTGNGGGSNGVNARNKLLENLLDTGKVGKALSRNAYLEAKKSGNKGKGGNKGKPSRIEVGKINAKLDGNTQTAAKFKLSKKAKTLVEFLKSAEFPDVPLTIELKSKHKDEKKSVKSTNTVDVELE